MPKFVDAKTVESTGAFLQGELERLDAKLYEPIAEFTWGRDMPVRDDATLVDEFTSFVNSEYAGGFSGTGVGQKSWISANSHSTPAQVALKNTKTISPLTPWGMELRWSVMELARSMQLGRPVDVQKYSAMRYKHQMDIDAMVYLGDSEIGQTGLLNNASVTSGNVGAIVAGSTAADILAVFNATLTAAWTNSQYARVPNKLLISPELMARLVTTQLPSTNMNLYEYVMKNNIVKSNGIDISIAPCKYLSTTLFPSATPKMVAYIQDKDYIRFPLVELESLPMQNRDFDQVVPYIGALGVVEFVRPECVYYGVLDSD